MQVRTGISSEMKDDRENASENWDLERNKDLSVNASENRGTE